MPKLSRSSTTGPHRVLLCARRNSIFWREDFNGDISLALAVGCIKNVIDVLGSQNNQLEDGDGGMNNEEKGARENSRYQSSSEAYYLSDEK